MQTKQLELAFRSLDFPGRTVLTPGEIAQRLGISLPQVYALVDEAAIAVLDVSREEAKKRSIRIPIESYRDFICKRLSGPGRYELLRQLPRKALEGLHEELSRILST